MCWSHTHCLCAPVLLKKLPGRCVAPLINSCLHFKRSWVSRSSKLFQSCSPPPSFLGTSLPFRVCGCSSQSVHAPLEVVHSGLWKAEASSPLNIWINYLESERAGSDLKLLPVWPLFMEWLPPLSPDFKAPLFFWQPRVLSVDYVFFKMGANNGKLYGSEGESSPVWAFMHVSTVLCVWEVLRRRRRRRRKQPFVVIRA